MSAVKAVSAAVLLFAAALLLTCYDDPLKAGRRLFANPLQEEIYPYEQSPQIYGGSYGGSYGSYGSSGLSGSSHYQVEQLIAPGDLLKLFKTAAGSPQDALQRMASNGTPNKDQWTSALQDWKWGLSRKEISSMFHGIDVDEDGKVTVAELLSCFRNGYQGTIPKSEAAELMPKAPQASPPRYDCSDGLEVWRLDWSQEKIQSCSLISVMELRGHLRTQMTAPEMVQTIDLDGDGAIDQAEWTAAATHGRGPFLKPITEPQAEFAFKSIDVSQDGTLSSTDLLSALDLADGGSSTHSWRAAAPTAMAMTGTMDVNSLKQRLLVKWATLSNAFDKMDLDGNHRVSREEWSSGLSELTPPLDSASASYFFEGIDALRDGHLTPPELQGTLSIGQLFQSPEALRKALHWDKATMDRHAKVSSWIHSARPNWQHDVSPGKAPHVQGHSHGSHASERQKLPLVQSLHGAFLSANDAFQNMDQDRSDDASMMEFKTGLATFQPPITGVLAEEAFHNLDRDGNGKVSRAEFAALDAHMPTGGSLNQNVKQLMSKAEEEFRMQASKWAGSMKQACAQLGTQVSLPHFRASIRNFEPLLSAEAEQAIFNQMDSDHDGFIDPKECHLSLDDFRNTLSGSTSLRNTFVKADSNNDHQLSREEFANFGQMMDDKHSKGKYAIFFEDELDTDHDGTVGLPALETILGEKKKEKAHDDLLSAQDLSSYDLPAIMHGKCIFTALEAVVSPGLRDEVGEAFATTLGAELSLKVQIVGVQEIAHPTMGLGKEFDLLYTSKAPSGAAAIRKLHDQARQIQATVEEAIRKVTSAGKVQAWCSSTLDFYGPQAGHLPKGSKIKEVFGQLPDGS